ncbi:unnamed protein product [Malus baccata var. baccata]
MASSSFKIESLLGVLTIRLQDDNFAKWSFQFRSVLEGYDLFDFFDGNTVCPPKYVISLKALLSLLIASLGDDAIDYVVGCKTTYEAWTNLNDRYATVSRARINHLKTELHTIKKGSDTVEKYLLRLKGLKDQLLAAGEIVSDNDLIVAALAGLPSEYNMIKIVIVARESPLTLKEFRAQLLSAEKTAEEFQSGFQFPMTGMYSHGESSNAGCQHGQTFNGNYRGPRFYPGESSNAGAQQGQNFNGGSFGFVGQNPRSNGNGLTGGGFNQANIPQHFHSNRKNGNSQRYNSRSRFNGGNGFNSGSTNRGNGYGNSGGNFQHKGGSNWSTWNGNSG